MLGDSNESIVKMADSLITKIEKWEDNLIQPDQKTFQDVINFPNKLNAEASDLMGRMSGMQPILTKGMIERLSDLQDLYSKVKEEQDQIINEDFVALNEAIKNADVNLILFPEG